MHITASVFVNDDEAGLHHDSGPFASLSEVDDRLSLLTHQPVSIRFERIL